MWFTIVQIAESTGDTYETNDRKRTDAFWSIVHRVLRHNATILVHLVHISNLEYGSLRVTIKWTTMRAAPLQSAPPTPSLSSMDGPRCIKGHLVCPSHQEERVRQQCATAAEQIRTHEEHTGKKSKT